MAQRQQLTVRLAHDVLARVEAMAHTEGRTVSKVIERALRHVFQLPEPLRIVGKPKVIEHE